MMEGETQVYFRSSVDLKARIEAAARAANYDSTSAWLSDVTEKALAGDEGGVNGPVRPPSRPETITLDEAAEIVLRHINHDQALLIADLCADNGATPKEYLLAYIALAHERGETATSVGEHLREDAQRPAPTLAAQVMGACEFCGAPFTTARRGQRFCPDPEDGVSCGRKATLRDLHAKRPPEKLSRQHEVARAHGLL